MAIVRTTEVQSIKTAKPWVKEPWAWFVLTPLIVVVLVSIFTVSLAITGADDVIRDNYYSEGRLINRNFAAENAAAKYGISGTLNFDLNNRKVWFEHTTHALTGAEQKKPTSTELVLYLSHPARADKDLEVVLQPVAAKKYYAGLDQILTGRWYIRVSAINTEFTAAEDHIKTVREAPAGSQKEEVWRLRGEVDFASGEQVILH